MPRWWTQIDEHLRMDLVPDVENRGPAPSQG
jgi:hypothetical protein